MRHRRRAAGALVSSGERTSVCVRFFVCFFFFSGGAYTPKGQEGTRAGHLAKTYVARIDATRFTPTHLPLGCEAASSAATGERSFAPLDCDAPERFLAGLVLDDARSTRCEPGAILELHTADADVDDGPLSVRVTLREGMHHQVKRMIGACGGAVVGLHRASVGPVHLDSRATPPGAARLVADAELRAIARAIPFELRGLHARKTWEATRDTGRPTEHLQRRQQRLKRAQRLQDDPPPPPPNGPPPPLVARVPAEAARDSGVQD